MARNVTGNLDGDRLRLSGQGGLVEVLLSQGTFSFARDGWRPLSAVRAEVQLSDGELVTSEGGWSVVRAPGRFDDKHGAGVSVLLRSAPAGGLRLLLEICAYERQPFMLVRLGLENGRRRPGGVRRLTPITTGPGGLAFESPAQQQRVYRHGWQSWTPSLSLSGAQRDIDARPPVHAPAPVPDRRGEFACEEVAALAGPAADRSMVLGFVSARRHWTQVLVRRAGKAVAASSFADGAMVGPGETLWSERLLVELADDGVSALQRYSNELGREMGARVQPGSPTGWCSWYYYFREVTEHDVLDNLRFLEQHRDVLPFGYVQVDDGYQTNIGDWTSPNKKFPRGMGALAREICEAGFQAGIWLAPFLVGSTSELYRQHPDWIVRDDEGAPVVAQRNWEQECYGLDCTHPKALAWLRNLFHEVTEGWGYNYVKIDFLFGGAVAGRRHDRSATRIEAYRRGLQAVRDGVGERFVLGCGALMGASVGLVDGQRIGPDVAPWWRFDRPLDPPRERGRPNVGGEPAAEASLRNIITRSWMHSRLWANDPDCLLARTDRTKLSLAEVQTLATAIALSGGMVLASDNMTRLSQERIDLISMLLPPLGQAASVPELLGSRCRRAWTLRLSAPLRSGG
jgi:alpha-galactosidase